MMSVIRVKINRRNPVKNIQRTCIIRVCVCVRAHNWKRFSLKRSLPLPVCLQRRYIGKNHRLLQLSAADRTEKPKNVPFVSFWSINTSFRNLPAARVFSTPRAAFAKVNLTSIYSTKRMYYSRGLGILFSFFFFFFSLEIVF